MIGQALATQYGRLLKTEYGYAVGFEDAAAGPCSPPPVSSVPAQAGLSAEAAHAVGLRLASPGQAEPSAPMAAVGLRLAAPAQSGPAAVSPAAEVEATAAVAATAVSAEETVLRWQQHAQQLAAQRDAALRDVQAACRGAGRL
jgi:hypothetical protein